MELAAALFLASVLIQFTQSANGDPNLYQYEAGPFIPDNTQISFPVSEPLLYQLTPDGVEDLQIPGQRKLRQLQQLQPSPPKVPVDTSRVAKTLNTEINEVIEALNQLTESREDYQESRAVDRGDAYGYQYPRPPSYGYPVNAPSYGPWSPSYAHRSPQAEHYSTSKLSLLKPDLLMKPVATKAASKVSGLIELVLALLSGSGSGDLELKGFKDIVIHGIVKPLLMAKGGLKSLISKLSIPVISLLLINLEVLITIWWLWEEDCPKPVYHPPAHDYPSKPAYQPPSYQPPPTYNYNAYR